MAMLSPLSLLPWLACSAPPLWANGARLPECGFSVHLCRQGGSSQRRLCRWLEYGHGLHDQPANLHHLVRRAGEFVCSRCTGLGLEDLFCWSVHVTKYSRRKKPRHALMLAWPSEWVPLSSSFLSQPR